MLKHLGTDSTWQVAVWQCHAMRRTEVSPYVVLSSSPIAKVRDEFKYLATFYAVRFGLHCTRNTASSKRKKVYFAERHLLWYNAVIFFGVVG